MLKKLKTGTMIPIMAVLLLATSVVFAQETNNKTREMANETNREMANETNREMANETYLIQTILVNIGRIVSLKSIY